VPKKIILELTVPDEIWNSQVKSPREHMLPVVDLLKKSNIEVRWRGQPGDCEDWIATLKGMARGDKSAELLSWLNDNYPSKINWEKSRNPQCADDYAEWDLVESIREIILSK
jgi:hypothetical protein